MSLQEANRRRGRRPTPVVLTDDERQALTSLARRPRTAPRRARRARIILACADGQSTTGIARRLHVSPTTVCKWRTRFLADRLDGLTDEPRPGAPRRITDAQVEDVVVRTLESTPPGATHWSTRGMAKAVGLSHTTVSRIWHAFGLQPHRTETFKLSPDPLLIDKVRDVVGLYVNPPEHAVVFRVDEKPRIQALERTAPLLPMQPGQVERWFAELTTRQLRRGVHRSVVSLERAIREFLEAYNADAQPFVWTKTPDEILDRIGRFAQRTLAAHGG